VKRAFSDRAKYREDIRFLKRGSRVRRDRQQATIKWFHGRPVPRKLMAWHLAKIRRTRPGYLYWAPLPADPEEATRWRQDALDGWQSLGWTDDGFQVSETLRGPSVDFVIVDELDAFRSTAINDPPPPDVPIRLPETEAGRKAIEWDRYRIGFGRKP